jgi:hypothetical protein
VAGHLGRRASQVDRDREIGERREIEVGRIGDDQGAFGDGHLGSPLERQRPLGRRIDRGAAGRASDAHGPQDQR